MEIQVNKTRMGLRLGDITEVSVDAVVNAASNELWMGGGVAGAIKRRGGAEIEREAVAKGPIPVGEAVVTGAGRLKARYVIHAAVMGADLKTDAQKIRSATKNSLLRAAELGIGSVSLPALGTGVGRFPVGEAAEIMIEEVKKHAQGQTPLREIIFVLYGLEAYRAFEERLKAQSSG